MTTATHAKPRRALICGSLAYDTIMVFPDRFAAHILPDKIHMLNVSFLVPELRREFGGCAGNIAYNLHLLGDAGYPMATAGRDFDAYAQWMTKSGVPQRLREDHRHASTPRRPSSPPTGMTTRSRRFIRAPCSTRTSTG